MADAPGAVGGVITVPIRGPQSTLNPEAQDRIKEGGNNYFTLVNANTGEEISPAGLRIGHMATIFEVDSNKVPLVALQLLADRILKGNVGDRKDPKVAQLARANGIKWNPENPATIHDTQSPAWQKAFNPTGLGNFATLGEYLNCRRWTPCPTNQSMGNIRIKIPPALIPYLDPAYVRSTAPVTSGMPPIASIERVEVIGELKQGARGVQIRITVKNMPLDENAIVLFSEGFTVTNKRVENATQIIATIDIAPNAPAEETIWVESTIRNGTDRVVQTAKAGGTIKIAPAAATPRAAAPAAPARPAAAKPAIPAECNGMTGANLQGCLTLYGDE